MSLRDYRLGRITDFKGWWSLVDPTDIPRSYARYARNCKYIPGKVGSREGFSPLFTPAALAVNLYNWITSSFNALLSYEGSTVRARLIDGGTYNSPQDLFTQTGKGLSVAESGLRTYLTVFDSNGLGAGQVRVADATTGIIAYVDKAFGGPFSATTSVTSLGAGNCSPGIHNFGFVYRTRTGFMGRFCPNNGVAFQPVQYQVAATGSGSLNMAVTTTFRSDVELIQPIMTTADNLEKYYFVPNAGAGIIPNGLSQTVNLAINIADDVLVQDLEDATDYDLQMTQTAGGSGPIFPSVVKAVGNRVAYVCDNVVYISAAGKPQSIAQDLNAVQLPGNLRVTTIEPLRGVYYLFGPHWTFSVTEVESQDPVAWPPTHIDSAIGTLSPHGVCPASRGMLWVADTAGLFLFSGEYPDRPISYRNQAEWKRINWAAAYNVEVKDDYINQRVYVAAPLDNNTSRSHILVWDYTNGRDPESVQFSLWDYNDTAWTVGGICIVQNPTTRKQEFWVAAGTGAGKVLRMDSTVRNDDTVPIVSEYETALLPTDSERDLWNMLAAMRLRLLGNGNLNPLVLYSADHGISDSHSDNMLSVLTDNPIQDLELLFDMVCQQASLRLGTKDLDAWWEMSRLEYFWDKYGSNG